jgi:CoA:oxalate CoA-transferase
MILADLGAEVIKIEQPGSRGDTTLGAGPRPGGVHYYAIANDRNKKSLTLALRKEEGKAIFYELVKKSDVIADNFRPGVMEKIGADYETVRKINPGIISCSITGFSSTGPYRDRPAYDIIAQAMGGVMSLTGEPGRPPVRIGLSIGDLAGGLFGAHGIMAAYIYKHKTGKGQKVSISMLNCQIGLLSYHAVAYFVTGKIPKPFGSGHPTITPHQAFKAKDEYFILSAPEDKFWQGVCQALGDPELGKDPRFLTAESRLENREQMISILENHFIKKNAAEWVEALVAQGVPSAPINTMDRALSDPDVIAQNMVPVQDHPTAGKQRISGNPIKLSETPGETFAPTPLVGEHTEDLLGSILGYDTERIAALKKQGIA